VACALQAHRPSGATETHARVASDPPGTAVGLAMTADGVRPIRRR